MEPLKKSEEHLSQIRRTEARTSLEASINLWWLKKESTPDVWYFKPDNHSHPSGFTLTWVPQSFIEAAVDIDRWLYWREYAKRLVIAIMESDKTNCNKPISGCGYGRIVRSTCEWLCFALQLNHIADVRSHHIESYEKYLASLNAGTSVITSKLYMINLMWLLKEEVGDGLAFLCYPGNKLRQRAKKLGNPEGRTHTIPPDDFFRILDVSLHEVDNASEWLEKLAEYLKLKESCGSKRVACSYKQKYNESSDTLFKRIRVIYASAITVVISLTAMRKHEATVLTHRAAMDVINGEGKLTGRVHKTAKTETGRQTERPFPKEGVNALRVIIELTEYERSKYPGEPRLLLRLPFQHSVNRTRHRASNYVNTTVFYGLLDALAKFVGLDYQLRPHMLRRAFAMLWTWRFEIGDLEYLSKFLLHNSYEFTKAYIEDPNIYDFLPEEAQRYTHEIFEQALNGNKAIKGGIGSVISKYRKQLQNKVYVLEPDAVSLFVDKIINKFNYKVIPNADGYCFMSDGRGTRARCSTNGVTPNYSNRKESHCYACPNFGVDDTRLDYWRRRKAAHEAVKISSSDALMINAADVGIRHANHIIKMFDDVEV